MIDTNEISGFIQHTTNEGWIHHTYLQCARRLHELGFPVPYIEQLFGGAPQPQQAAPVYTRNPLDGPRVPVTIDEEQFNGTPTEYTHPIVFQVLPDDATATEEKETAITASDATSEAPDTTQHDVGQAATEGT